MIGVVLADVPFTTTIIMSVRDDISTSSLPSPSLDPSRFGSPSISFDVSKLLPEEKSAGAVSYTDSNSSCS